MACSCIKRSEYDVHVGYLDCKTLVYEDQSKWMTDEGFVMPDLYDVTISIPSLNKEITLSLYTQKRNLITVFDLLGSTDYCLPDDIYCFTTTSCGISMKVSRAYMCGLDCKIDVLTSKMKNVDDAKEVRYLRDLSEAVKVNAKLGKHTAATENFTLLKNKLNHLTCGMC